MISRRETQAELLVLFGELISPLVDLIRYPDQQTPQTRAKLAAKFTHDNGLFKIPLLEFTKGEPGHEYLVEFSQIRAALNQFGQNLHSFRDDTEHLKNEIHALKLSVTKSILSIPCEVDPEVLDSYSPFTAYLKIKSIVVTTSTELVFVDPWVNTELFSRYLHHLPAESSLTLITTMRKGRVEFDEFLKLSKLYGQERGKDRYKLMYNENLHDRYLKSDDVVFHLGGSLKDAGNGAQFTISKLKAAPDSSYVIHNLIQSSFEQFGPSKPQHP